MSFRYLHCNSLSLRKTGMMVFGDAKVNSYIQSLKENNTPHRTMTGKEANAMYSKQLKLPDEYICVTEEDGGILKANTAVMALQVNKYLINQCDLFLL